MSLMRRTVRVQLRNDRTVTGTVHITEGQSLASFLTTKLHFLNLTDVRFAESDETLEHVSIRIGQILWVEPLDQGLHLSSAVFASEEPRRVELHVEAGGGWRRLHIQLNVARETRMSDHLDANPGFIAAFNVWLPEIEASIDRLALNQAAIATIRELDRTDPRQR